MGRQAGAYLSKDDGEGDPRHVILAPRIHKDSSGVCNSVITNIHSHTIMKSGPLFYLSAM